MVHAALVLGNIGSDIHLRGGTLRVILAAVHHKARPISTHPVRGSRGWGSATVILILVHTEGCLSPTSFPFILIFTFPFLPQVKDRVSCRQPSPSPPAGGRRCMALYLYREKSSFRIFCSPCRLASSRIDYYYYYCTHGITAVRGRWAR